MWFLVAAWGVASAVEPQLPVYLDGPRPAYPERALERAIEGDVVLELTIDETGSVVDVVVVQEAGHGFDGPAAAIAWSLRFAPATDERGEPVAAIVQYRVPFRMAAVPPLAIEGVIREKGTKKLIANARIRAVGPDGSTVRTVTDDRGAFRFADLPPGSWMLTVDGAGLVRSSSAVVVPDDGYADAVALSVEREPDWQEGDPVVDEFVEVIAEVAPEPAERALTREQIVTLPGSLGDPVRALQNLPGVSRAPFGSGQLLVRGTESADTGYYLDGIRLPLAFHFTGVSTVVPADLLADVELSVGGFGPRYGRAIGGVVELNTDDDLPRRGATSASADLFQATAFTRQRLGKQVSLAASVRRSYIDAVAQPILAAMDAGAVRVPKFYDASVHLVHSAPGRGRWTGTFLLSEDRFRLLAENGTDAVTYRTAFQKLIARWWAPTGSGWNVETALGVGPEIQEIVISEEDADLGGLGVPIELFGNQAGTIREESPFRWQLRHEWVREPGVAPVGARLGLDWSWGRQSVTDTLGKDDTTTGDGQVGELYASGITQPAIYAESTLRAGPVDLMPGARVELARLRAVSSHGAADPRLRAVVGLGGTEVLGNVGFYSQPPTLRELLIEEGPTLSFERSFLVSGSVEQRFGPEAVLGAGLYHQTLWDLVSGRDNLFRFDQTSLAPPEDFGAFENQASGRGYGLEVHGTYTTEVDLLWMSLTLGRSWRTPYPGAEERPAEADQPVNLVLIASRELGRSRVGARFRYVSGAAATPVLGGAYLTAEQEWAPIFGEAWSDRLPAYLTLDLRIDHELRTRRARIDLYGELQNATNHRNVEVAAYSADWSEFTPTTGLPILPAFGLKVTW